ncbi:MAG: cytochrome c family protein [Hyphomicrobiaceae bacterium]|nr:cytochrome c family protein [Hyphomicrobiaceae bacterium]
MDSFEFNKIAGAALSALLFIFGASELGHIMSAKSGHDDGHGKQVTAGYTLPMPKGGAAKGGAPAAEAFNFASVATLLPKASADNGKDVFKACLQCHTPEKGGATKQGPNLYGIIDRDIGKHPGFTSYSPALAEKGGKWTWEALANYLHDPKGYIPGNRMSYAGVKDTSELADLLTYLRTLADNPAPLPAAPAATPAAAPKQ